MTFALIHYYVLRILEKAAGNVKDSFLQGEIDTLYNFLRRLFPYTVPSIDINCEAVQEELFRNLEAHPVKLADCLGCLFALKQRS
ncbi:hypothetical protein HPULCUR_002634 [Helicostylum pulchrum]|uniref:Uncharacterized protein n=1 Tax=Helicostylum pulchrum TaxID=562976 RepID=A0ABP9XR26_9FUNG